jgi:predicted TIM-barrel fold metal-dependent hydrolase
MHLTEAFPTGYIDAHHHVWAPETMGERIGYGWLRDIGAMKPFGDPTPIQRDYGMEEFLAEAPLPPRASVHVQTDGALPDPVAETAFVQAQADTMGHRVGIVALADLSATDLDDVLAGHGSYPDFCGVRQIVARLDARPDLSFAPRDLLADKQWVEGLKRVEGDGLAFDLQMYPEQAGQALEALSATPALRVIIDHALCPFDASEAGYSRWHVALAAMAERPNTWIKLSGFGMYRADWAETGSFAPHIEAVLEVFGPKRVMWGSNYPVEKLATGYAECLDAVLQQVPEAMREDVFSRSAAKAYGLHLK